MAETKKHEGPTEVAREEQAAGQDVGAERPNSRADAKAVGHEQAVRAAQPAHTVDTQGPGPFVVEWLQENGQPYHVRRWWSGSEGSDGNGFPLLTLDPDEAAQFGSADQAGKALDELVRPFAHHSSSMRMHVGPLVREKADSASGPRSTLTPGAQREEKEVRPARDSR